MKTVIGKRRINVREVESDGRVGRSRSKALDGTIVVGLAVWYGFAILPRRHFLVGPTGIVLLLATAVRLLRRRDPAARTATSAEPTSTLVSIVAHEIRSPLAALRGAIALVAEHGATIEPARRAELLHVALDATTRLGYLVDDLLLVSRITGRRLIVERTAVDVGTIVHDAARAAIAATVTVAEQDDVPLVMGDPIRLRQVVTNLLENAIANASEATIVLASITHHDGAVRVTVYNDGRGIPPEEQSRLFLPFAALSERRTDSLGLGLYIAKELIEAMGGSIGFETQPGRNAAFWFSLAAAPANGPALRPARR